MKSFIAGAWKSAPSLKVIVGGVAKVATRTRVFASGAWRTGESFVRPLTATASRSTVGVNGFTSYLVTPATTITPDGGIAPFSYSWARLSGEGDALTPTSATTTFGAYVGEYSSTSGTFRCTVTDGDGATVTVDVTANFTNLGGFS